MNHQLAQQQQQPVVTGRRIAGRARVALPATFETVNGTARAVLRNISTTGAMLEVAQQPTVGASGVLACAGLDCFGEIVWVRSRWCGFAFDEPIAHHEVLRLRQASDQASGSEQRDVQDAARRWAEGAGAR